MTTPVPLKQAARSSRTGCPSALNIATYAVELLENNPLFNSGHGAVFTRDGINELEASVMVSSGFAKRGVGVTGLRRVKNPILLARKMLEHGEGDLRGNSDLGWASDNSPGKDLDIPSAQGVRGLFQKSQTCIFAPWAKRFFLRVHILIFPPCPRMCFCFVSYHIRFFSYHLCFFLQFLPTE